jgi:hydroxymethylpyrimidine/phosphomethylpyrimidine kinase
MAGLTRPSTLPFFVLTKTWKPATSAGMTLTVGARSAKILPRAKRLEGDDGVGVLDARNGLHLLIDEMSDVDIVVDIELHEQIVMACGGVNLGGDLGFRKRVGNGVGLAELAFDLNEKGNHRCRLHGQIASAGLYYSLTKLAGNNTPRYSVFKRSMSSDVIRGWIPVRVKKTRQTRIQSFGSDSVRTEFALVLFHVSEAMAIPIALTIAGSDSSGGAGIQADLKTFAALGVYGASVITAVTAQNTQGVSDIHGVPPAFVAAQLDAVFADLDIKAVKIGMAGEPATIEAIASALARWSVKQIVLDPVMIASSGGRLLSPEAVIALRKKLVSRATLITPNLPEAAALLEEAVAFDESAIESQGKRLLAMGCDAVLIKGGHAHGAESTDYLFRGDGIAALSAPRIATANTHGTGCSLSSAIAAGLAKGEAIDDAVRNAKTWITEAIAAGSRLDVGHGHGPLHHFHRFY